VNLRKKRFGIDIDRNRARIAGASLTADRKAVDTIIDVDLGQLDREVIDREGELYLAVSESDAIIKRVEVISDRSLDPDKLAQFELAASLLDDPERYYLESCGSGRADGRIAVAYDRSLIDTEIAFLQEKLIKPSGFKLRSWAMALGYLHYCRQEGGALVCLIDISPNRASFCLLRDRTPIDFGFVTNHTDRDKSDSASCWTLLTDLAATIQYRLGRNFRSRQDIPLSLILLTGSAADDELAAKVETVLRVKTRLPALKKELFADNASVGAEKYLACLGLIVD
jgi:hypothetical protein